MGIPVLNHLDLRSVSELRNAILHKTTDSAASNVEGKIIYDTGANKIKFYDGSQWQTLGTSDATGDIEGVNITAGAGLSGTVNTTSGTHTQTLAIDLSEFSAVTPASGDSFLTLDSDGSTEQLTTVSALQTYMQNNLTFVTDANVTHRTITAGGNTLANDEALDFVAGSNITISESGGDVTIAATDTNTQLTTEQVQDIVGGMLTGNTETNITVTYQDSDGTIDFVSTDTNTQLSQEQVEDIVGGMLDGTETGITVGYDDTNGNIDFVVADTTVAGDSGSTGITPGDTLTIAGGTNVTTAMSGDTLTITATDTNTDTLQSVADSSSSSENFVTFVANASGAQTAGSDSTFVYIPSSETLKVKNLIVSGDTTTASETVKVVEDNTLQFEGASGSTATTELNLTTAVLSGSDKTITLPNSTGTVALTSDITGTNSGTNTGDQNLFSTVAVSGQSNVVADTTSDTLTLAAGSNVTITTNASSDTITIASTDTNTQLSTEQVQDIIGAMVSGNTETNIAVTYDDSNGKLDFVSTDTNTQLSLASKAEVQTGTNTTKAVTPDTLAAKSVHATIDVSDSNFASNLYAEITHNLGTEDVFVQAFDSVSKGSVIVGVARTDKSDSASTSKVKISFSHAPTNDIEVIITSIKGSTAGSVAYN